MNIRTAVTILLRQLFFLRLCFFFVDFCSSRVLAVEGFGGLAIDGDNSLYEQQSTELEVVLKFPPKARGWAGRHTLRIVTAPNVMSNNRISSVRVECEGREDIEVGTPVYGSTTIDVTVNVPTVGFMIIVR